ncbi:MULTISPECIES: exo-beta-N-acetylmuramidase NamZ domain-containing protein [unclassified Streptomyces]|uniref:exo-beta-N-acetylmuramidase NamZ family protein n=1 Tax=unclassified Streptomyces TaxID=2593676 RepID=UPI0037F73360
MSLSRRGLLAAGGAIGATGTVGATGAVGTTRTTGTAGAAEAPAPPGAARSGHGGTHRTRVRTGFDRLAADGYRLLSGRTVGVVTNPTGVTADVRHIVDVMHADDRVRLTAVFGPEHGFRGTAQAGGSEGRYDDPATGLPVYDTYLKSGQPLADVFTASGVDTVVFDIQDAGARFYTYIWTLYDCMEAAALAGKRFVVLDRPNPVTGRAALGPVLRPEFATFVGRRPIAQAHGMTVTELARLFNGEFLAHPVPLETVRMSGWARDDFFDATGLPWVPPSPNMPTPETALVYAGTCLFEGTNLSEGRGTTRPFELLGAEGLDGRWAEAANALELPGVRFREAYFAPTFSKFQGKTIGGVQLHVHDRESFDPVRTGIGLLVTARRTWSGFAWRSDHWIDKLTGSADVRTMIDAGAEPDEVADAWQSELAAFRAVRRRYLLYR